MNPTAVRCVTVTSETPLLKLSLMNLSLMKLSLVKLLVYTLVYVNCSDTGLLHA
jgi:hypothetical protein